MKILQLLEISVNFLSFDRFEPIFILDCCSIYLWLSSTLCLKKTGPLLRFEITPTYCA